MKNYEYIVEGRSLAMGVAAMLAEASLPFAFEAVPHPMGKGKVEWSYHFTVSLHHKAELLKLEERD